MDNLKKLFFMTTMVLLLSIGVGISAMGIDDCSSLEDMTLDGDY